MEAYPVTEIRVIAEQAFKKKEFVSRATVCREHVGRSRNGQILNEPVIGRNGQRSSDGDGRVLAW